MAAIRIQSAGFFTTVQDAGRLGYQMYGMPVSGAMDVFSMKLANLLVGNNFDEACLETTLTGPEIIFETDAVIAITGADMQPVLNGKAIAMNKTLKISCGNKLGFAGLRNGARTYIAFAGGLDIPVVMGSRSTYLRAGIGGFEGRALKAGDVLNIKPANKNILLRDVPKNFLPQYSSKQILRVIRGPECDPSGADIFKRLITTNYSISPQSDRMGYRLSGMAISKQGFVADIISSGLAFGTIQLPGNGIPIILMADRPTTGGYARIAVVAGVDHMLLAQLKPGDSIYFAEISPDLAQELYIARKMMLASLK